MAIEAVRVTDDDLAEVARVLLPDVPVRVAATPEIDDLQHSMNEHFAESGARPAPTYLDGSADPALVAAFFEAAAGMWRAKPWKAILAEEQVLCVHAPELGLDEAVVLVVGASRRRAPTTRSPGFSACSCRTRGDRRHVRSWIASSRTGTSCPKHSVAASSISR